MKKVFFILFLTVFSITGCKNFLQDKNFLEELETVIEVTSAPEISLYIEADANTGTVSPSGKVSCKVGQSFSVIFTEAKEYSFIKWEVIDRDTKEAVENVLDIVSTKDNETKFKVLSKKDNVLLHPLCSERPQIDEYSPRNSESGVARDSSIIITFSKELSEDNDFSGIKITSNGSSVKNYYKEPVLNKSILTFAADTKNLLDTSNGLKSVTVTIPSDIYYKTDNGNSTLGNDFSWTFKVNGSSDNKTEITFAVPSAKGQITPDGTIKYNLGEVINLKYEPEEEFEFTGWSIVDSEGETVADSILKIGNVNSAETTITVAGSQKGISITPGTVQLPKIVSMEPINSNTGINCDSPIIITFSKKMDASQLESFDYISIEDKDGNDLSEYFLTPGLSDDGKTLTIKTRATKPLVARNDTNLKQIYVTLNSKIVDIQDNKFLEAYYGTGGYKNYYSVNNERSTTKPFLNSVTIARTVEDLNDSSKQFVQYSDSKNYDAKNHVKDTFAFKCNASDENGISYVSVTSKRISDFRGDAVSDSAVTFKVAENKFVKNNDGTYSVITEITPDSFKNKYDGLYQLDFTVYNYAGKCSDEVYTYWIASDTANTCSLLRFNNLEDSEKISTWYEYKEELKFAGDGNSGEIPVYWSVSSDYYAKNDSITYETSIKDLSFIISWGTDQNNLTNKKVVSGESSYYKKIGDDEVCSTKITIEDKYKMTYLRLTVVDILGNEKEFDSAIPAAVKKEEILYYNGIPNDYYNHVYEFILESYDYGNLICYGSNEKLFLVNANVPVMGSTTNLYLGYKKTTQNPPPDSIKDGDKLYFQRHIDFETDEVKLTQNSEIIKRRMLSAFSTGFSVDEFIGVTKTKKTNELIIEDIEIKDGIKNSKQNTCEILISDYYSTWNYYVENYLNDNSQPYIYKLDFSNNDSATHVINLGTKTSLLFKAYNTNGELLQLFVGGGTEYGRYYLSGIKDTNPPIFKEYAGHFSNLSAGSSVYLYNISDTSGLKKSSWSNNLTEYEYIWLPYDNSYDSRGFESVKDISEEKFNSYSHITGSSKIFSSGTDMSHIELFTKDLIDDNRYVGYVKISDSKGNYIITPTSDSGRYPLRMATLKNKVNINKKSNTVLTLQIKDEAINETSYYSLNRYFIVSTFDDSIGGWNSPKEYINYDLSHTGDYYTGDFDISSISSKYLRISYIWNITDDSCTDKPYHSYPVYYYTGSTTCTAKYIISGEKDISVMCNEPCLYYICSSAIGYGNNIDEWERRGAQLRPKQISTSENVDTSCVPAGDYYVVIAHYADGSTLMSDVYKK